MAANTDGYSQQLFSGLLAARGINSDQINQGIQAAISGQNAANKANNDRYNQGLTTLQNAQGASAGLLQGASDSIANAGQAEQNKINLNEQQGLGNAQQSAVSRGLNDTTIQDSLNRGVQRDAADATTALQESVGRQQAAVKEQQATEQLQGNNTIANFIAARNDNGPNMGLLSQLITGAASDPKSQRTGTTTRQSVPGNNGSSSSNGLPSTFATATGGGYTIGANGQAIPYGSTPAPGSFSSGGGSSSTQAPGGNYTQGAVSSALTGSRPDASISNALSSAPTAGAAGQALTGDAASPGPITSPFDSASKSSGSPAPAKAYFPGAWAGSENTGYYTKDQWDQLSAAQQKSVAAGDAL